MREEDAGLHPADQEGSARLAHEAPDVHAPEREPREAEREPARDLGRQVVPVGAAVPAPVERVALTPGPGRAGPEDRLPGGPLRHLRHGPVVEEGIEVVHAVAGRAVVVDAVERRLLAEIRLDHARAEVEEAPQVRLVDPHRSGVREVDAAHAAPEARRVAEADVVEITVRGLDEAVHREQLVEEGGALRNVRELPEAHLGAQLGHLLHEGARVGEALRIELQVAAPVVAEPVGVEVQHVGGNRVLAVLPDHLERLFSGAVGDPALPEAEAPARRHGAPAGEVGVAGEDLLRASYEEVVVEEVVLHGHLKVRGSAASHPAGDAGRVVQEDAPAAGRPEERDVLVAARRRGPHGLDHVEVHGLTDLVERQELLSEAEDALPGAQGEALDGQRAVVARATDPGVVGVPGVEVVLLGTTDLRKAMSPRVVDPQPERGERHVQLRAGGAQRNPPVALLDLHASEWRRRADAHGRRVLGHRIALGVTDAEDVLGHRVDAEASGSAHPRQEVLDLVSRGVPVRAPPTLRGGPEHQRRGFPMQELAGVHEGTIHVAALEQTGVEVIHDGMGTHERTPRALGFGGCELPSARARIAQLQQAADHGLYRTEDGWLLCEAHCPLWIGPPVSTSRVGSPSARPQSVRSPSRA